jgi:hypothetical protein
VEDLCLSFRIPLRQYSVPDHSSTIPSALVREYK